MFNLIILCTLFFGTHGVYSHQRIQSLTPISSIVVASWYGKKFQGRTMANGEEFDMFNPQIAAHRTLPFGTKLRLTNVENGLTLLVVVKDRGPFIMNRALDLSYAGAMKLGFVDTGTALVFTEVVF